MAATVAGSSPLRSATSKPWSSSPCTADSADGRSDSTRPSQPQHSPLTATPIHFMPPSSGTAAVTPSSPRTVGGATSTSLPDSVRSRIPPPASWVRSRTSGKAKRRCAAPARTPLATGCCEPDSMAAASASSSDSERSPSRRMLWSWGVVEVRVPVLSNTTSPMAGSVSMRRSEIASRPARCSTWWAAVRAVGVASESAQGQVTTSTDRVIQNASSGAQCNQRP